MRLFVWLFPPVIAVIAIVAVLIHMHSPDENIVTGMVEVTEIDVASKIPGRVDSIFVLEGDQVESGRLLATLESREVDAKVEQARGVMEAARAKMDLANAGARVEEREAVEGLYRQAQAQYDLAEKTYHRIQAVFADSVISLQERDEVEFKYKAAHEQLVAARAKYDMVERGARDEEIRGAQGLFHQAKNAYNEALVYQQETRLVSPVAGEVSKRLVDAGEMVAAGYPVFTILDPPDVWIVIQLREDRMTDIRKGMTVTGVIPALGDQKYEFRVAFIAPMADFATWRSTNQKGDFDLKTFELHLRPTDAIEGMRSGMSARIEF